MFNIYITNISWILKPWASIFKLSFYVFLLKTILKLFFITNNFYFIFSAVTSLCLCKLFLLSLVVVLNLIVEDFLEQFCESMLLNDIWDTFLFLCLMNIKNKENFEILKTLKKNYCLPNSKHTNTPRLFLFVSSFSEFIPFWTISLF